MTPISQPASSLVDVRQSVVLNTTSDRDANYDRNQQPRMDPREPYWHQWFVRLAVHRRARIASGLPFVESAPRPAKFGFR